MINRSKSAARRLVAAAAIATLVAGPAASRADVFTNVPEANGADFHLVYTLPIGNSNAYTGGVPYSFNGAASIADNSFSRVGYYLELQSSTAGAPLQYLYASFNADGFSRKASTLGVPNATSGAFYQQNVQNMNVVSNAAGITAGTGIATGNVEFWPLNYVTNNAAGVPGANSGNYDFGDQADGGGNYGSMQIHNYGAGQTLLAFNNWNNGSGDAGIGNDPNTARGNYQPDWTFSSNVGTYSVKTLQVVVGGPALPPPPPPPPPGPRYMPLGDSITEGAGANGGYRTRLYQNLAAADPTHRPDLIGSSQTNASSTLLTSGETNHEGHGGYRIDQIKNNLNGSDGTGGNNGGFWLPGTGGRGPADPNFVLLHIGTNDILQNFNVGTEAELMAARLDDLVNQITTDRPDANLLVASIIPINDVTANALVKKYNDRIEDIIVPKYEALGRHVYFVDQYSNFVDANGNVIASLLPDNVHPGQAGYDLMGDTWSEAIQAIPEPSTFAFFAAGFAGLLCRRTRKSDGLAAAA